MAPKTKRSGSGHVKPESPAISLHQLGRLRTRHVLALAGWSHSTLYNRLKSGKFPAPQSDGRNYWTTDQVREALDL